MKKNTGALIAIIIAGLLVVGSGTVYAAGQIAKGNAISEQSAVNFAYVDAGISPEKAVVTRVKFDYENGRFVYDIEFHVEGTEYEYDVDAFSGSIVSRSSEKWDIEDDSIYKLRSKMASIKDRVDKKTAEKKAAEQKAAQEKAAKEKAAKEQSASSSQGITLDEAKSIALKKAGQSSDSAVFSKAKQDYDDGMIKYEIDFYVAGVGEYEYDIDASTGIILEESFEPWVEYTAAGSSGAGNTYQTDSGNSGGSSNSGGGSSGSSSSGSSAAAQSGGGNTSTVYYDDDYYDDDYDDDWDDDYDDVDDVDDDDWDDDDDDDDD